MEETVLMCRKCGKKLLTYSQASFRHYKSPLKNCKKCGTRYADPRCHEIAVEGIPNDTFSYLSYAIMGIAGGLLLWRGIHLFRMYQLGLPNSMQWLLPTVFVVGGAVMVVGGLYELITIATGIKAKKYDRLRKESELRLQNKDYAHELRSMGYIVPEEYL